MATRATKKLAGLKVPKSTSDASAPKSRMDAASLHWLGIPATYAARIVGLGLAVGAGIETFMVKVWIGSTNFYEVVKKKEAEKIAEKRQIAAQGNGSPADPNSFAAILKAQWEERKREMRENAAASSSNGSSSTGSCGGGSSSDGSSNGRGSMISGGGGGSSSS